MDKNAANFLEVGKTSQDDVLDELGAPTFLSDELSLWIYFVKHYLPTGWRICAAAVTPSGAGAGCPTEYVARNKLSLLEIQFDSSRSVADWKLVNLKDPECTEAGFCWNGAPLFRTAQGVVAKTSDLCAIHFYTSEPAITATLKLEGIDEFELSMTSNDYQPLLKHGQPEVRVSFDDGSERLLRVPCQLQSAHFVQLSRGTSAYEMRYVSEHEGRRAVIGKQSLTRLNF
jgi:hypothetical protein